MCPPSSTGIGSRLSSPRFRLIDGHQAEQRNEPGLGRLARQLRDADWPHQLLGRRFAGEEPAERPEDEAAAFPVLLHAHLDRLEQARLDALDLIADPDADDADRSALDRCDLEIEGLPVAGDAHDDRLSLVLADFLGQLPRGADVLRVDPQDDVASS